MSENVEVVSQEKKLERSKLNIKTFKTLQRLSSFNLRTNRNNSDFLARRIKSRFLQGLTGVNGRRNAVLLLELQKKASFGGKNIKEKTIVASNPDPKTKLVFFFTGWSKRLQKTKPSVPMH